MLPHGVAVENNPEDAWFGALPFLAILLRLQVLHPWAPSNSVHTQYVAAVSQNMPCCPGVGPRSVPARASPAAETSPLLAVHSEVDVAMLHFLPLPRSLLLKRCYCGKSTCHDVYLLNRPLTAPASVVICRHSVVQQIPRTQLSRITEISIR